jgi:hypothetical protein
MAQHQKPWPPIAESPPAYTLHPDGVFRSDRALAGPLRMGTAQGAGPKNRLDDGTTSSDMGVDRASPRKFDPAGTSTTRGPAREESPRISREARKPRY